MKPTNEELIKDFNLYKDDYFFGRIQGRLDVLEEWLDYQLGVEECLSNNIWLREEIAKIKEVLK